MSGLNKAMLIGRLGKDPELKTIGNGNVVANFTVATSESYKDKTTGDRKEITDWHNVVLWRALAEIAGKFLHKGDLVYIEGKIRTRSWEQGGAKHYITEIIGDNLTMLLTQKEPPRTGTTQQTPPHEKDADPFSNDDLPF